MSFRKAVEWSARVLAVGAVALVGKSADAAVISVDEALTQEAPAFVPTGDISVGYVVVGDVDSDGGGTPPRPE